jgi:hypothetical protein
MFDSLLCPSDPLDPDICEIYFCRFLGPPGKLSRWIAWVVESLGRANERAPLHSLSISDIENPSSTLTSKKE